MLLLAANFVCAGDLNPAAAPNSTMKTIDQVDPRIPLVQTSTSQSIKIFDSGSYYLTGNLTSSVHCIMVYADDVTIDLMGFSLDGSAGTLGYLGIYFVNSVENALIKNGTIKNFSSKGVYSNSTSSKEIRVIDMTIRNNAGSGIDLAGSRSEIQNCKITGNGSSYTSSFYGIRCSNSGNRIIGNTISGNGENCSGSYAYGIFAGVDSLIEGNIISDNFTSTTSNYIGAVAGASGTIITENVVNGNFNTSSAVSSSAYCISAGGSCHLNRNVIYSNGTSMTTGQFFGISTIDGATVTDNVVSNNAGGANVSDYLQTLFVDTSTVQGNGIYYNGSSLQSGSGPRYGLYTNYYCVIKDNLITSNGTAIHMGTPAGCVVVDNSSN